jgi:hypothetical protein
LGIDLFSYDIWKNEISNLSWRRERITGDCRNLRNLYSPLNIITIIKAKIMRWRGSEAGIGKKMSVYKIIEVKPEGKRPL